MKKIPYIFIVIELISLPLSSLAAAEGLLPCQGEECNSLGFCGLAQLGANVLKFAVEFSLVIATAFIIYGAFLILTSGASPANLGKGKSTIFTAIIGVAVVLLSWLLVDTILKIFTGQLFTSGAASIMQGLGPWNSITCQ